MEHFIYFSKYTKLHIRASILQFNDPIPENGEFPVHILPLQNQIEQYKE